MRGHAVSSQRKFNKHWQSGGEKRPRCVLKWTMSKIEAQAPTPGSFDSNFMGYIVTMSLHRSNTNEVTAHRVKLYSKNTPIYTGGIQGGFSMALQTSGQNSLQPDFRLNFLSGTNYIIFRSTTGTYDLNTIFYPEIYQGSSDTPTQTSTTINDGGIYLDYFTRRVGINLFTSRYLTSRYTGDFEYEINIPDGWVLRAGDGDLSFYYLLHWALNQTDDGTVQTLLEDSIDKFEVVAELW